jgi:hypothetical protein
MPIELPNIFEIRWRSTFTTRALLVVSLGYVGACSSSPSGGATSVDGGGAANGGAGNGGTGNSSNGTGGADTGGTASGGASNGGTANGGSGSPTGGSGNATSNGGATANGGTMGGGGQAVDAGPIVAPEPLSPNIVVDQIGYRTSAEKIAVARSPQTGFDTGKSFTPGAKYALVDAHGGKKVFEGATTAWNGGATDDSSGDKAWWFDFSSVTTPGDYFVLDETNDVRSDVFAIDDGVYRDVLVQSTRMLYYQRDGFAKTAQYAGANWVDGAAHMGQCYLYSDGGMTLNKDLHGGWWDAGDFNKYTNWGDSDAIELLHAYVDTPSAFTDDTNIPESGNGVADILDEIKWELDFVVRMQNSDGSVLSVVDEPSATATVFGGSQDTSPSKVTAPCKYGPASTSASLTTAAAFAYAATVFKSAPGASAAYAGYADNLTTRAVQAWTWAQNNPAVFFYNSQNGVAAGEQEVPQNDPDRSNALLLKHLQAAVYLFEATSDTTYRDYFDANYAGINLIKTGYADGFHGEEQETLLEYTHAPNATASITLLIKNAFAGALNTDQNLKSVTSASADPYLAYLQTYVWGSNQTKSDEGNLLYDAITFDIDASMNATAAKGAERYVHYFDGVNPLGMVYLSNMGDHGVSKSITRFYHSWYQKGSFWDQVGTSKYGPPPGYLVGGPNPSYAWDSCCPGNCSGNSCGGNASPSPPTGQPSQKSYLDFNDNWPLDSWQISEPDDGYQAKYIRLVSKFVK